MKIRECIERPLSDEPQSVVKVYETAKLRTDIQEYVLTDRLAQDLARVLEAVIDSARPGAAGSDRVGIWISGFFGSGKSHFAKLAGHLLADTPLGDDTARSLFRSLLHRSRPSDEYLRELFQQAANYRLACHLVTFDITALHTAAADRNVGLTFLRGFYRSLGLSDVIPFAERELELQAAGKYEQLLQVYEARAGVPWEEDKDLTTSSALFAECLAELLPHRYSTPQLAAESLRLSMEQVNSHLTVEAVVDTLLRWLDARQKEAATKAPQRLVFVADEVGAWAGRDIKRIEQLRSLVEMLGATGQGRIWLLATSQEKLSAVVQNTTADRDLLQRLEARFGINVHLESSEVGTVIEDRILRKRPTSRSALVDLWESRQAMLRDIAESPGLELGANYRRADRDYFVADYPFLPYQIEAAADIFGGMRGVKVSSGARSMIRVVFDATRELADADLGTVVSWDRIFDSANRDNEFADEQYLGSHGLEHLNSADRHVEGVPIVPSCLLKTLWLMEKSPRIPRTERNLARLLVNRLDSDVLEMESHVAETLAALARRNFVRQEVATGQWKFLTQDEVTVEKIVRRLAEELKATEVRQEVSRLYSQRLLTLFNGRITHGKSNTTFEYGVFLSDVPLKSEQAPVKLRVACAGTPSGQRAAEESEVYLEEPVVYWVVGLSSKLEERLRRAMAIERLPEDEEFRRIATDRTRREAEKLEGEAVQLRRDAETEVEAAFRSGTLYYAGDRVELAEQNGTARARVEAALRNRIDARYHRFSEGDRLFKAENADRLFTVPPSGRAGLDPDLGLFDGEGHVHGNHVLVEAVAGYLKATSKNSGQELADSFAHPPYGWQSDLLRYVAAAMFVDGKLSVADRAGKRYENPRDPAARALFGTQAFKNARLEVEEDALTPAESSAARSLLTDLGHPTADSGEVALGEATLLLCGDLSKRLSSVDKAREVDLPLPEIYGRIGAVVEGIESAGSRARVIRALLAEAEQVKAGHTALQQLEEFGRHSGFAQYRRSQQLLAAALQAGLAEDPTWGSKVRDARDEMEALKQQRRVLEEWDGAFQRYRLQVLDAFRGVYLPLRKELAERTGAAHQAILDMPEYQALEVGDRALVRTRYLAEGKPLHPVTVPELRDEQQLLAANSEYSIPHLQAALAALDTQLSAARGMVVKVYQEEQERKGQAAKTATWDPKKAFAGKRFDTPEQVDAAFDAEKERLKALILEGKAVQVV